VAACAAVAAAAVAAAEGNTMNIERSIAKSTTSNLL
jgi:hypothetical protein